MKINQLPRQENVTEIDFGTQKVLTVAITDENKIHLMEAAFSMYLGEKCKYCGKKYRTMNDLKDTVWAGEHKHGRLACRACWSENNKAEFVITKQTALAEK